MILIFINIIKKDVKNVIQKLQKKIDKKKEYVIIVKNQMEVLNQILDIVIDVI